MWIIFNKGKLITLEEAITLVYDQTLSYAKYCADDHQLGEDILHNVYEKLLTDDHKRCREFESVMVFKAFVKTSIRNRFFDIKRSGKRSPIKRYKEEVFDVITKVTKADIRTDQALIDQDDRLIRKINKIKIISSRSHLTAIQYLVVTLRMNDYSFKEIAEITGSSINTVLGQMRYGKNNFQVQFKERRVRERRRKRFREGREGRFNYEDLLLKLPPYQYFVIKMKRGGIRFEDIAKLENAPTSTIYYRFKWAKRNLEKMAKSEEDYKKIIEYIDSLNTNVGGRNWHKDYIKNK